MENQGQETPHEEEMVMEGSGGSPDDQYFDRVVGALEKIVLSDDFQQRHETFCRTHCREFDENDTEENKLSYMELFEQYTSMLEGMLEDQLTAEVPDFDMERFQEMLSERGGTSMSLVVMSCAKGGKGTGINFSGMHADELNADIFDLLISMGDFEEFKSLMISYKVSKRLSKVFLYFSMFIIPNLRQCFVYYCSNK